MSDATSATSPAAYSTEPFWGSVETLQPPASGATFASGAETSAPMVVAGGALAAGSSAGAASGLRRARIRLTLEPDQLAGLREGSRDEVLQRCEMSVDCMSGVAHARARVVVRVARLAVARSRGDSDDGAALRERGAAAVAGAGRLADHELAVAVAVRRVVRVHRRADADQRDVGADLARLRERARLVNPPADRGDLLVHRRRAEADRRDGRGELRIEHDEGDVVVADVRRGVDDDLRAARAPVALDLGVGRDAALAEEDDEVVGIAVGLHGAAGDGGAVLRASGRGVRIRDAMTRRDDQVGRDERARAEVTAGALVEGRQDHDRVMLRTRADATDDGLDRLAQVLVRLVRLGSIRAAHDPRRETGQERCRERLP